MLLSLSHNLFWGRIKNLLKDKKCFICGNRHPDPGNCFPILQYEYIMAKDEGVGGGKKLAIIPNGRQISRAIPKEPQYRSNQGVGSILPAKFAPPERFLVMPFDDSPASSI